MVGDKGWGEFLECLGWWGKEDGDIHGNVFGKGVLGGIVIYVCQYNQIVFLETKINYFLMEEDYVVIFMIWFAAYFQRV